jgi:hypothetical protein
MYAGSFHDVAKVGDKPLAVALRLFQLAKRPIERHLLQRPQVRFANVFRDLPIFG